MRANPTALGALASAEAHGDEGWVEDEYAYGPLSLGITAAAVNEAAQHCEDLFALLKVLREPVSFARKMANYSAGKVVDFGRKLVDSDDDAVSRLFLIPNREQVRTGVSQAADPAASIAAVEAGRARLGQMVRETAEFYRRFEDFHIHYKHGLKLPLRPFGTPTDEAIAERKSDLEAPLIAYTNEPISAVMRRAQHEPMMFKAGPRQQAHLVELVADRNLLRLRLIAKVSFDELVERSHTVFRLLVIAQSNRLALGHLDEDGNQSFSIPGERRWDRVDVTVRLEDPLSLEAFADPRSRRS
jgi:hypothetical protein